ncbi:MAG TPA: protein kinase [Acidothermaceae bacterium]|jgi:serine/threonine protein kinase
MAEFSLPGYDVEELVGFGGSGEVWRARDSSTGEVVALKRLRGDVASLLSAEQLQREAALLATVRHDHIVALRSVVSTNDGIVLVLDYAEGGSLAAVLGARSRLSAGEVVTIGAPLAQALSDIASRGLTHGDVTSGNIVFDGSGKPLLADLGVANLIGDKAGPTGRTPGYADPAGVGGEDSSPASDVHGLAAVCFTALAGVLPYRDSEPKVARALGPLAPDAPAALVAAIEAGLDPSPETRPDAAAFGRALFASCAPVAVRLVRGSQRIDGTLAAPTHVVPGSARAVESPEIPERPRSRFRRGLPVGRHRWSVSRRALVGRAVAVACVVALLGAAVAIGIAWGWADHGHRASASVPVTPPASPAFASVTPSALGSVPPSAVGSVPPSAGGSAAATPFAAAPTDWISVVGALDRSRDSAFADADAAELDAIYVPGSAALTTDRATLGRLVGAGERVRGLQFVLGSVQVVSQTPGEVTLAVVDTLASYDVLDPAGVATHVPGRGLRKWTVVLRAQPPSAAAQTADSTNAAGAPDALRWRIASIAPA